MSRPTTLKIDGVVYWVIMTYTDASVLVDADSTPTVAVRKNGVSTVDAVTVTKRSATTGIYDCSYNPSGEAEGDTFTIEETATISSQAYVNSWQIKVIAAERGTDSASTFDPATDTVANVTLVATTTTNTDMRGTDGANTTTPNTVAPDNASIAAILVDTADLQANQGQWLTASGFSTFDASTDTVTTDTASRNASKADVSGLATASSISALNNFDPANDDVAVVTLVGTTTTNSDMRGTDGANTTTPNTVVPDNASIAAILVDTADLQANQGQWLTATGFSTFNASTDTVTTDTASRDASKADVSSLATAASIAALNDFNAATDTVANVTLVATTTTNTDMRGTDGANTTVPNTVAPDNASIAAILVDTADLQANQGDWVTATGFATPTDVSTSQGVITTAISGLNDFDPTSDVVARVTLVDTTTDLTNGGGGGDATAANQTTIISAIGSLNDFDPASDTVVTDTASRNASKADVTGLATASSITALNDFDPVNDVVANVSLVGTTTTNTDMRGTDGANTIAPDNASVTAIKTKTDSLTFTIANQVDSNALSGGGSGLDAAGVRAAVGLASANLDTQLGDVPTVAELEARTIVASAYFDPATDTVSNVTTVATVTNAVTTDAASRTASQANVSGLATASSISSLNNFDPASDTVARVTLVDTTTTNTDMRGTDGANTTSPNTVIPDNVSIAAIKGKTDQFVFSVANQVDANALTGGISESSIRSAVGLSSANLDTQLGNIPTVSEFEARTIIAASYFDPANDPVANVTLVDTTTNNSDMRGTDSANTIVPPTTSQIASAILSSGDVDGYSLEETLKLCLSVLAGKISGAGTGTITIRSADDTADRVVATTDSNGNRLSITINEG